MNNPRAVPTPNLKISSIDGIVTDSRANGYGIVAVGTVGSESMLKVVRNLDVTLFTLLKTMVPVLSVSPGNTAAAIPENDLSSVPIVLPVWRWEGLYAVMVEVSDVDGKGVENALKRTVERVKREREERRRLKTG